MINNSDARKLINAFWFWADNITKARLKELYGEDADDFYLEEKIYKINQNPLFWWTSLDLSNQTRLVEILQKPKEEPKFACYAVYHLDDNGEADSMNFYCSAKCRETAFPDPSYPYAVGEGDCIKGTKCELCGKDMT